MFTIAAGMSAAALTAFADDRADEAGAQDPEHALLGEGFALPSVSPLIDAAGEYRYVPVRRFAPSSEEAEDRAAEDDEAPPFGAGLDAFLFRPMAPSTKGGPLVDHRQPATEPGPLDWNVLGDLPRRPPAERAHTLEPAPTPLSFGDGEPGRRPPAAPREADDGAGGDVFRFREAVPHDLDPGIVNVEVGMAPLRPAEFVILRIGQHLAQPPDLPEDPLPSDWFLEG